MRAAVLALLISSVAVYSQTVGGVAELERAFKSPPDDSRIMMRWWWFGPAVTTPQLEHEMRLMKEGGIGGFEVQPVYPLALDDESRGIKTLPFLSDEFIEALRFTSDRARQLGLRLDMTLGSGWPYGGPQVPVSQAAGRLRVERVKVEAGQRRVKAPHIGEGESLIAVFAARSNGEAIEPESLEEIPGIVEGAVWLPAGMEGSNQVLFFISSRTGMQVKRPAIGSEGFVLDHFDRAAIDNYLKKVGDRLMQAFGSNPPYAVFCDSLEVYGADWTGNLLEEFRRRRGYDLKPHLAALVTDAGPKTAAIRRDWGRTLTELFNENFLAPLHEWSKRNRTRLRVQGYGLPAVALSSNAHADLIEGEGHQWKRLSSTRWASSASHLYGRPVTSSETWTWLHSPSFRATPLDMKAEADRHFLQGINQLIGHGWPYTAEGVEYPGWRFYAAGVFNERNPWWIVMPDVSRYLQRLSFLLRQGRPANDVAIYLPNDDAWASFRAGHMHLIEILRERLGPDIVPGVLEAGYGFDFFDDDAFKQVGRIEGGALALGPNKYRVVIFPNVERIPLDTLEKFDEFARSGGILIATQRTPALSPGFLATEADHRKISDLSRRLFEGGSAPAHFVKEERTGLAGKLNNLLRPDLALSPAAPEIGFVHRSAADAEIYFLANTSNIARSVKATFRVRGMNPEWWDPFTGNVSPADVESRSEDAITIPLELEPYGSRVLVFTNRSLPRTVVAKPSAVPPPVDLSAGWRVSFGQGASPVHMDRLRSWTEDEKTRYFSGAATYERTLTVPGSLLEQGIALRLDFGEGRPLEGETYGPPRTGAMHAEYEGPVREAAVVYINDRRAGSVWCPPYSLDVTGLLRPGENSIRIVVANTAMNHMAGRALPDYRLLNLRYGERFQAQHMDKVRPVASGLLGPVRLIPKAAADEHR